LCNMYDIDVFMSINDDYSEYYDLFIERLKIKAYFFERHEKSYKKDWFPKFRRIPEDDEFVWYKISSAYYNNKKAFELISDYQKEHDIKYDIVIKFRADAICQNMLEFEKTEPHTVYLPFGGDNCYNYDNSGITYPGVQDHLAYGDFETMKIYSSVYDSIETYCPEQPYHPEVLLLYHLQQNHIKIIRWSFPYSTNQGRHHLEKENSINLKRLLKMSS